MACPENITSSSPSLSRKHYLFISWLVQETLPLHLMACPENITTSSSGLSNKHYLLLSWLEDEEIIFSGQAMR
jgi:hypothetical protein